MILSTESQSDILEHIRGLCKKIQSVQADNYEETKKIFESTLKKLESPEFQNQSDIQSYSYYLRKLALEHFKTINYKEAEYYTELLFNSSPAEKETDTDLYILKANLQSIKEAYEYSSRPHKYNSDIKNSDASAITYNNLGNIFLFKKDYDEALIYFQRAAAIFNNKNLNRLKSTVYQNIAAINFHLKNYSQAISYLKNSIEIKKLFDDLQGIAFCNYLEGKIYFEQCDYENAIARLSKSSDILNHTEQKEELVYCSILLARTYLKIYKTEKRKKILKEAKNYLKSAEELTGNIESKTNLLLHLNKAYLEFYEAKENFEKANKILYKLTEAEKKIQRENVSNEIAEYKKAESRVTGKFNSEIEILYKQALSEIEKIILKNEKQKNDALGNIVHDLKNPIGNIKQLVEYLINETELSEEEKNDFKLLILESAETSLGFVTKLLDTTAMEQSRAQPKIENIDINQEIIKLIKFYKVQTGNKSIDVIFENKVSNKYVNTDKDALLNILDNLFSNAIKFSPKGKNIFITISEEGKFMKIEVKDEGPGFNEGDKKKLFRQFSKLSARPTGGEHSSGLGLSIVKKLVDSLHGTIEAESEPGKGANMIVRIPIEGR
ncbi:MAG: tetratricopeptide repeat-containing sensor histidine kinase [Bacteroidetes bacterium]|nr:tetratricopeptide repeat-containing sensor histidine kinase [Bacteroidota bacterium]